MIEQLPKYRADGRFQAWLFVIVHRLWLDEARSAWQRYRAPVELDGTNQPTNEPGTGPLAQTIVRERRELLLDALMDLPDDMRQTVLLRIDGELKFREIAETTNCPLGTVLWRMREAERRLSKRLGLLERERQS